MGEHGIPRDSVAGRNVFARRMELRRRSEDGDEFKPLKRGWFVGDKQFRKELLAQMKEQVKEHHYGEDRNETELEHAEKIIQSRLKKLGWKEDDLAQIQKGHSEKVRLALDLRKDTTSTIKWIAARLHMGSWTYLNHLLYWHRKHASE